MLQRIPCCRLRSGADAACAGVNCRRWTSGSRVSPISLAFVPKPASTPNKHVALKEGLPRRARGAQVLPFPDPDFEPHKRPPPSFHHRDEGQQSWRCNSSLAARNPSYREKAQKKAELSRRSCSRHPAASGSTLPRGAAPILASAPSAANNLISATSSASLRPAPTQNLKRFTRAAAFLPLKVRGAPKRNYRTCTPSPSTVLLPMMSCQDRW